MKGEFYRMEYEAWDEGTDALTLEQEAAYLRLCHQMYRRRGAVPDTPATLARLWRCHPNKARKLLEDLIEAGKVTRSDQGLTQIRVRRELDHRGIVSTHRADAGQTGGRRSGEIRRKSMKSNDPDEANASSPSLREEKSREELLAQQSARDLDFRLREAAGLVGEERQGLRNLAPIETLLAEGVGLDDQILPAIRAVRDQGRRGFSWAYYLGPIRDYRPAAPSGRPPAASMTLVLKDSPEGIAWAEHELAQGHRVKFFENHNGEPARHFPSRWPPNHPQNKAA